MCSQAKRLIIPGSKLATSVASSVNHHHSINPCEMQPFGSLFVCFLACFLACYPSSVPLVIHPLHHETNKQIITHCTPHTAHHPIIDVNSLVIQLVLSHLQGPSDPDPPRHQGCPFSFSRGRRAVCHGKHSQRFSSPHPPPAHIKTQPSRILRDTHHGTTSFVCDSFLLALSLFCFVQPASPYPSQSLSSLSPVPCPRGASHTPQVSCATPTHLQIKQILKNGKTPGARSRSLRSLSLFLPPSRSKTFGF